MAYVDLSTPSVIQAVKDLFLSIFIYLFSYSQRWSMGCYGKLIQVPLKHTLLPILQDSIAQDVVQLLRH